MVSGRKDGKYNAEVDASLNIHTGGGYRNGINSTSYSYAMSRILTFWGYVFCYAVKTLGEFIYSAIHRVYCRQHMFVLSFLRALAGFCKAPWRRAEEPCIGL